MKKLIIVLLLTLSFVSCKKNKESNNIIGKWKLMERYDDPGGGNGTWKIVPDSLSYVLEFNSDNTYNRVNNTVTISGTYNTQPLNNDVRLLILKHNNFLDSLNLYFEYGYLILNGSPYSCDESCAKKFKKINN